MCDPLTIAGAVATAGSMVANQAAQSQVSKARNGAMAAERIRQQGFEQEASALNNHSRDQYNDFSAQEGDKASKLGQYFTSQNAAIPEGRDAQGAPVETMPTASSNIVVQEQNKQNARAKAFSNQQGEALGQLRGFGDLLADTSRVQARDASQVGQIGGFEKGSSAVLPYELEAANGKGAGLKMFGDILGGLGNIGVGAGLAKGGYNLFGIGANAAKTTASTAAATVPGMTALSATGAPMSVPVGKMINPYSLFAR
jgi:hypothetical protein